MMLVRYITYLAIVVHLGVVCLGFAPARERNLFRSFLRIPHQTDALDSVRGKTTLWVETNDNKLNPIHNDRLALDKLATRFTSRRKALILSGAVATTAAVATRTGGSPIPGLPHGQQEGFSHNANGGGIYDDDTHSNQPNKKSDNATTLLESSSLYKVQTKSTTVLSSIAATSKTGFFAPPRPSVKKISQEGLLEDLQSKRAIFLGEHHPEGRDHRLQAALIRSLYNALDSGNASTPLVVGLEAVQRQFQPVLDQYCEGRIDEEEVFQATEWESRWYWSFEAYKPILQTCRELGIGLLALDISTEDRHKVEQGGLQALDPDRLEEYIPDPEGFSAFGSTAAYQAFVSYTLNPPYELQQRTPLGKSTNSRSISFSNFVARQMLRDEGMASAAEGWLSQNPHGILVGCIGINHATFGCGVPGRLEQKLSKNLSPSSPSLVASVLINPEPLNTGTELKICPAQGQPPADEEEDDDGYSPSSPRQIFVPNRRNQVCIENSLEVQNYALQLEYLPAPSNRQGQRSKTAMDQATRMRQARRGETILGLSDYLVFSPRDTNV